MTAGFQVGVISSLALSVASSVAIVICNKALISTLGFPFATTLTSWHLMVTFCTLHVAQRLHFFEPKAIDGQTVILFGLLNGTSIGLLNLSLGFNSIGFYQMTKLAIIPFTVLLETIFLKKRFSTFLVIGTTSPVTYQVARNIDLVYGGGSVGLMGLVSRAVYNGGRHVIGVIPKTLMPREITGETVGEVKPVADMHQRKAEMARQSDAFIALPGGYGTLEELLEVIAWAQLGIHDKPVGLLNVDGYYNSLLSFIDKAVEEEFISPTARNIIVLAPTPKELLQKLEEYSPGHEKVVPKTKWEMEQLSYCKTCEIPGLKEGTAIIEAQRGSML
ncbi:hypothetical protein PR202_gb14994 [Eleusine coracana subsp. coracana]|uniref:cytokinin riboside 5'-monophosphate phosphoribohydrolase n=1 Tax=Eleusine coracana subsp. coracana TaxID=191504 RepID=A0AAV5EWP4_ELECO|nr:hypothetical protein PR202_gb14994 [Eleusine coracana subsp. coracana]